MVRSGLLCFVGKSKEVYLYGDAQTSNQKMKTGRTLKRIKIRNCGDILKLEEGTIPEEKIRCIEVDVIVDTGATYDEDRRKRITTIEMIVDEKSWNIDNRRIPKNKIMHIRVDYGEIGVARLVKTAGGRWNREKKVWELAYQDVLALGLSNRIVT